MTSPSSASTPSPSTSPGSDDGAAHALAPESTTDDAGLADLAHALMDAARAGDAASLLPLVEAGAPVNMQDAAGNSMLMLAAYHGHAPLVEALAARGADVDLANDRGQTPLAGAVFKGYADVIQVLVAHGADPDTGSPSARATAGFFGRSDLQELLG